MPDGPDINTIAGADVATAGTTILNSILLYFPFYRNLSSKYITRQSIGYF